MGLGSTLKIGQTETYSIVQLDASGAPLATQLPFDAPPVFSEDTPGVATLSQAPLGATADVAAVAAGKDTVTVVVSIGGQKFTDSDVVTVAAPVVLPASIKLVASAPTP